MFTPEERAQLRSEILEYAGRDRRISGAAITGSAAAGREDRWSDVDLAFGVADAAELPRVLSDFTAYMYDRRLAVHHMDMPAGAWIYRVFLLPDTLQVDLAFVPAAEFGALAPGFRLVFGEAREDRHAPPPEAAAVIGLGWLYALHVRSALERRKPWQAEYMLSGLRNQALALASIRHGLPAVHARGIDDLPEEITAPFAAALPSGLGLGELARAFRAAMAGFLVEIERAAPELAKALEEPLKALAECGRPAIVPAR